MQYESKVPDKVLVHCTDNGKEWEGTVLSSYNGVVKVLLEGVSLNFNQYKKKNLYVVNFSGMELTISL